MIYSQMPIAHSQNAHWHVACARRVCVHKLGHAHLLFIRIGLLGLRGSLALGCLLTLGLWWRLKIQNVGGSASRGKATRTGASKDTYHADVQKGTNFAALSPSRVLSKLASCGHFEMSFILSISGVAFRVSVFPFNPFPQFFSVNLKMQ